MRRQIKRGMRRHAIVSRRYFQLMTQMCFLCLMALRMY